MKDEKMKYEKMKKWIFLRNVCCAFIFSCFNVFIFSFCANRLTPQGGPVDSLPPMAVSATPENGQRHFDQKRIFIEFNEYVQLKDQGKEFFTSPLMKTKPTLTIRDKGVRIDIKDTLVADQTYSLNFGNSIVDLNEGNPLSGFRYVFSTGPALDSMLTTGYTADAARGDSISRAMIFFYDARVDSLNVHGGDSLLFNAKPQVVGRGQGNGIFIAQNLKDIDYRVYAFEDNNSNFTYEPGVDKVGFLDEIINPATLEPISIWLDEYRHYPTAEPQTYIRLFSETPRPRQNLAASERTERHRAELRFSAPWPQIDTLTFEGIEPGQVIREYLTADRDTMALWFNVPPEQLRDTIRGRISYLRTDSLGELRPEGKNLALVWRLVETREQEREREREERERERALERGEEYVGPEKPNPFRFKVDASSQVNPKKNIPIEFGLPLVELDSLGISLTSVPLKGEGERVAAPFRVVRDTMNIRRWVVTADWDEERKYRLVVPQGAFVNVAGERNDSLGADFSIVPRSDFATLAMSVSGRGASNENYIVTISDGSGKMIERLKNVVPGSYLVDYVPEGDVTIRIVEDLNGNGRWDSGNLVERRQPERTEMYVGGGGDAVVPTRANWEVAVTLNMGEIFAPVSMDNIRAALRRAEDIRVSKLLEERARQEQERRRNGDDTGGDGSMGIGSAMGGMRDRVQSTAR